MYFTGIRNGYLANNYFITASVCALSPLQYSQESADTIIAYAKANQPVLLLTCPISGVSAPIGEIASLVLQNAEILSGLVLAQCVQPGIPVIYGISHNMGDLRNGTFVTSSPEAKLVDRASIQQFVGRLDRFQSLDAYAVFIISQPVSWQEIQIQNFLIFKQVLKPCRIIFSS